MEKPSLRRPKLSNEEVKRLMNKKKEGRLVAVHVVKAYMGFRVLDSLIRSLNFTTQPLYRQESLVSLKFFSGPLKRKFFLSLSGF
jgi:hypothetical protein